MLFVCIQVLAMLHGGDDFRFIYVEEYGWASSYRPRTSAGDIQTMVEASSIVFFCVFK